MLAMTNDFVYLTDKVRWIL